MVWLGFNKLSHLTFPFLPDLSQQPQPSEAAPPQRRVRGQVRQRAGRVSLPEPRSGDQVRGGFAALGLGREGPCQPAAQELAPHPQ
jgi:hypothetical protein